MALVYQHYRKDKNCTFYIGVGNSRKRALSKSGRSSYWHRVVSKSDYEVSVLIDGLSNEDARKWEMYLIGLYGRSDLKAGNLVNLTDGGDGSVNLTEECRQRLRELNSGPNNFFYGKSFSGQLNPMYGKKRPDLAALNKSRIGIKNPEQAERMRARSGELGYMWGKSHSDSAKAKMAEARSKKVIDISTGFIYKNTLDVTKATGINNSTLKAKLIGRIKNNTPFRYL